jgi:hypothetical protein
MAACSQLTQLSAWKGTDEEKTLAVNRAANLKNQLQQFEDCDDMGCCTPPLIRINNDGSVDMSTDGGTTWTPATGQNDPRNPSVIFPPPPGEAGDDKRCKAANSVVSAFEIKEGQDHDALVAEQDAAQIGAILIAFLVGVGVIATGGALALLGAGVAAVVTSVSATDFADAFTDDVWSTFLCQVYCLMDGDGQLTDTNVRSLQTAMAGVGGVAGDWFNRMLQACTAATLNNIVALQYAGTRDCSECDCHPGCDISDWIADADPSDPQPTVIGAGFDGTYNWVDIEQTTPKSGTFYYFNFHAPDTSHCCKFHAFSQPDGTYTLPSSDSLMVLCSGGGGVPIVAGSCVQLIQPESNAPIKTRLLFLTDDSCE